MPIANELVTEISRHVAAEQRPDLDIIGIMSSGGSEHLELLLAIHGDNDEPRRFLINLPRTDVSEFESELRLKLNEVVRSTG